MKVSEAFARYVEETDFGVNPSAAGDVEPGRMEDDGMAYEVTEGGLTKLQASLATGDEMTLTTGSFASTGIEVGDVLQVDMEDGRGPRRFTVKTVSGDQTCLTPHRDDLDPAPPLVIAWGFTETLDSLAGYA